MSDHDEKLPPLPGLDKEEITDTMELEDENPVENPPEVDDATDEEEEITPDTVFTEEELELYDNEELEEICKLKKIEIPDDGVENSDLKLKALILGTYEPNEEVKESKDDDFYTEEDLEDSSQEELLAICEEYSIDIPDDGKRNTKKKLKAVILGTYEPEVKEEDDSSESEVELKTDDGDEVETAKAEVVPDVGSEDKEVEEVKAEEYKRAKVPDKIKKNPIKEKASKEEKEVEKPITPKIEKEVPEMETPKVKEVKRTALTKKDNVNEAGVLDYRPDASLDDLLAGAQKLIDGGLACGHSTPEAVLGVVKYGAEIGMSAMTSLNNIHMVSGKPTLGVHAIASQLKKFGVTWEILQNFEQEEDGDFVTTIKFTDLSMIELYKQELAYSVKKLNGKAAELYLETIKEEIKPKISQVFSYRWSDANTAGLLSKSNWANHPKTMQLNRCLTLGGRAFKPEALLGLMETMEYAEVTGTETDMEDSGHVVVLDD